MDLDHFQRKRLIYIVIYIRDSYSYINIHTTSVVTKLIKLYSAEESILN